MKAEIKCVEKRTFLGISGSGFTLPFGTASGEDGIRAGPTAMELVLISTGGCSAWDVVQILEKGRENIADCVVELDAERAEDDPQVFTRIHMHYIVSGRGPSEDKVARAIKLSAEKYCSASAMLSSTANISHDFEVIESA